MIARERWDLFFEFFIFQFICPSAKHEGHKKSKSEGHKKKSSVTKKSKKQEVARLLGKEEYWKSHIRDGMVDGFSIWPRFIFK